MCTILGKLQLSKNYGSGTLVVSDLTLIVNEGWNAAGLSTDTKDGAWKPLISSRIPTRTAVPRIVCRIRSLKFSSFLKAISKNLNSYPARLIRSRERTFQSKFLKTRTNLFYMPVHLIQYAGTNVFKKSDYLSLSELPWPSKPCGIECEAIF